jgi:decaprenylphospho-beta-D-ribofuranose 2-oxidase
MRAPPVETGPAARTATLTGWGRVSPSRARVVTPDQSIQVEQLLRDAPARGVIARGLGRSYNNAAQNSGGMVIEMTRLNRICDLDPDHGAVTCEAGVSLDQLMRAVLPAGWFVPVSPGTRQVTIGGAIAADVHGKNHHKAGSFARHVHWFDLLLPHGQQLRVTPGSHPELFWATAGGMGLTGVVIRARVQLTPVETASLLVDTIRTDDLDQTMACLAEADARYGYTVAWLDCLAAGAQLGRSVVTSGDFAARADLPPRARRDPLAFNPPTLLRAPAAFPPGLVNRYTVALANEAWYRKAPRRREGEIQTIGAFFHPLDGIRNWNTVYGPAGFRQYQFVVPFGQEPVLRHVLEQISAARAPSFVTVLKRFGPGDDGYLSFPLPGWTLALDFPARTPGLADLLVRLDRNVLTAGGRVYLAKDSRVSRESLEAMYPRLPKFRALRAELDPAGLLVSDLSRRLGM